MGIITSSSVKIGPAACWATPGTATLAIANAVAKREEKILIVCPARVSLLQSSNQPIGNETHDVRVDADWGRKLGIVAREPVRIDDEEMVESRQN